MPSAGCIYIQYLAIIHWNCGGSEGRLCPACNNSTAASGFHATLALLLEMEIKVHSLELTKEFVMHIDYPNPFSVNVRVTFTNLACNLLVANDVR